jgi:hypothetical protein
MPLLVRQRCMSDGNPLPSKYLIFLEKEYWKKRSFAPKRRWNSMSPHGTAGFTISGLCTTAGRCRGKRLLLRNFLLSKLQMLHFVWNIPAFSILETDQNEVPDNCKLSIVLSDISNAAQRGNAGMRKCSLNSRIPHSCIPAFYLRYLKFFPR